MKRILAVTALALSLSACASTGYAAGHGTPAVEMMVDGYPILTNAEGLSLYTWDTDPDGASRCNGGCAANWPPHMAPDSAHDAGDFTVVTRGDGAKQWAYKGRPLYTFIRDSAPGDVTGDGVGGTWHLARP